MRSPWLVLALSLVACNISEPTDVEIVAEAPLRVARDDTFEIVARVRNTAPERQTLVDLDIADSYLEGIAIQKSEPPFSDAQHIPIDNSQSYSFDLPIDPGQEVVVRFQAVAVKQGDFSGDVDFCINSDVSFVSYPIRTVVE